MRIGMLIAFAGRRCGGPEVYERELVRALMARAPHHEYHLYCLDQRAPSVIGTEHDRLVYHLLTPSARVVSMAATLPLVMARTRPDVFHAPVVPPPFCPPGAIIAMPCSSLIRHPEFFPLAVRWRLRFLLHRAVPKAAKIVCASVHVRDVVQERFGLPPDRLPVGYPGISEMFRPLDPAGVRAHLSLRFGIHWPYLLFSGRWEHRKNLVRTVRAFAHFKRTHGGPHKLVLTGGRSWASADVERAIVALNLGEEVVDLGRTPLDELPYLYGGAEALVYASLWEGFGMPIVESMACGTPVITSNVSAMPETAGGAALLADPTSVRSIADAMHRITSDTALHASLRERGLQHARGFGWDRLAAEVLDLYGEVAERTRPARSSGRSATAPRIRTSHHESLESSWMARGPAAGSPAGERD